MKRTGAVIFLSLVILMPSCGKKADPAPQEKAENKLLVPAESLKAAQIEVQPAEGGEIVRTVSILGDVKPNGHNVVKVTAGVGGIVRELNVKPGDEVKPGTPLALLESREAAEVAFSLMEQQQRLSFARQAYEREKSLLEKQLGTREAFSNALQDYQKAQLDVSASMQKMRLLGMVDEKGRILKDAGRMQWVTLRSPLEGTVVERYPVRGEFVEAQRELFVIMDLSSVWVEVQVPPSVAAQTHLGQSVQMKSRDVESPQRAVVVFVAPVANPETRMVTVRLLLSNKDRKWRPGTCATAEFVSLRKQVPVRLPLEAVQEIDGAPGVFVEEQPGVFTLRRVVLGESDSRFVEIAQVSPGERVVVKNALLMKGNWLAREQ